MAPITLSFPDGTFFHSFWEKTGLARACLSPNDDSPQDLISYIEDLANWDVLNVLVCPAVANSEQLRSEIVRELVKPGRSLQVPWLRDSQNTLVLGTLTLEGG